MARLRRVKEEDLPERPLGRSLERSIMDIIPDAGIVAYCSHSFKAERFILLTLHAFDNGLQLTKDGRLAILSINY